MPKVSVIVPIYKVEKYIERCAISLFAQTLEDMEFIFINDCTPDKSMEILLTTIEKFPKRKPQIRIVNFTLNKGLAATRQLGIQMATGDYLICCDSDDWINLDLYSKLYEAITSHNADIAICDFVEVYNDRSVVCETKELPQYTKEAIKNIYRHCFHLSMANKLVKRSIFVDNDIVPYEGINMWEDNGIMYRVFYHAHRLVQIRDTYYYYNLCNESSITNGYREDGVDQKVRCATKLTEFFRSKVDADEFKSSMQFLQFLAKVNMVTTRFSGIKRFKSTFPETKFLPEGYDKTLFSAKARFRMFFIKHNMVWVFILLAKVQSVFGRYNHHY